ncbi:SLC18B1 [Bugula neritina]|uniref:SLC18B1 n=1 Tax=Bugula neritina TaxID=10212 RepID=A0A7J7KTI6_BUGNE|nr:SLC18B1 [Bugula neritina]
MGNCNNRPTSNLNSVWKERLLVVVVLTIQFVALCTDTFLYPFFPQEATAKGLTPTHIGIVFSSFEFARFLTFLTIGYLISKANPKHWCVVGGGVTSVCCVLFGLVDSTSGTLYLVLCSLTRFLAGSGSAMLSVAAITLLLKSRHILAVS